MHDPEPQFEELPTRSSARLERADRSQAIVDPRTDRAVVDDARALFPRGPAAARASAGDALGAAARRGRRVCSSPCSCCGRSASQRPADDVDGSGRVDILDAFALARSQAGSRERRRARARGSSRSARSGAICAERAAESRPARAAPRSRGGLRPRRAAAGRGALRGGRRVRRQPRCRSRRGSSSCTSGTARCRSWASRTATSRRLSRSAVLRPRGRGSRRRRPHHRRELQLEPCGRAARRPRAGRDRARAAHRRRRARLPIAARRRGRGRRATDRRQDHSRHSNGEMTMSRERRRFNGRWTTTMRESRLAERCSRDRRRGDHVLVAACASTTRSGARTGAAGRRRRGGGRHHRWQRRGLRSVPRASARPRAKPPAGDRRHREPRRARPAHGARRADAPFGDRRRSRGEPAVAEVRAIAGPASLAAAGADVGREAQPHGVAGSLSRVRPGEEIWVIETLAVRERARRSGGRSAGFRRAARARDARGRSAAVPGQRCRCRSSTPRSTPSIPATSPRSTSRSSSTIPYSEKIEAVYIFPLPHNAAVNEFVMTIGDRQIRGIIREKEEAQQIYAEARAQGYRGESAHAGAAEHLHAEGREHRAGQADRRGHHATSTRSRTWTAGTSSCSRWSSARATTRRDSRIPSKRCRARDDRARLGQRRALPATRTSAPATTSASRSNIDAGVAIEELACIATRSRRSAPARTARAQSTLAAADTIPNKDFVLRYSVAGEQIKSNLLTHTDPKDAAATSR